MNINLLNYTGFLVTHAYTGASYYNGVQDSGIDGGHEGLYSVDSDFNTYMGSHHVLVDSGENGHNMNSELLSQHIFNRARNISVIKYRLYSYSYATGINVYITWTLKLQYTTNGTDWIDIAASIVTGSTSGSGTSISHTEDAGEIDLTVNLSNVLGVRAYVYSYGSCAESHTETGVRIYEIQAMGQPYDDIGLKYYKGGVEKIGVETLTASHKLRVKKGSTTYGIPLLTTADTMASAIRIYSGGVKSLPLVD